MVSIELWENHPDIDIVKWIQARSQIEIEAISSEDDDSENPESIHSLHNDDSDDSQVPVDELEFETSEATNKFKILSTET